MATTRLVTAPKAWAWTKDMHGNTYDLTEYIVGGRVDRLVDQVSTAELTLRNPDQIFTNIASSNGPVFHPMDPIVIFLERVKGYPVRVFTGFLDETPYYQMFPGTIKLTASCTLKRLLYTFFDPALPYFISFLEQFGWTDTGTGTAINLNEKTTQEEAKNEKSGERPKAVSKEEKETEEAVKKAEASLIRVESKSGQKGTKNKELQDKSIGRLLWALIYYVAQIRNEHIYIEEIPEEVSTSFKHMITGFEEGQTLVTEDLEFLLKEVIGTSSQGEGGITAEGSGSTGNLTNTAEVVRTMSKNANAANIPPEFVICTSLCECGFQQSEVNGTNEDNATGWFQFTSSQPYGSDAPPINYPTDARDTGISTNTFCKAVKARMPGGKMPPESEWNRFSFLTVQVAGPPGEGYPEWTQNLSKAKQLISQYANSVSKNSESASTEQGHRTSVEKERKVAEETQRGATDKSRKTASGTRTRISAMIEEANKITSQHYHYSFGGGHGKPGVPSMGSETESGGAQVIGFDCSGSSGAALAAGGLIKSIEVSGNFGNYQSEGKATAPGPAPAGTKPSVSVYYNAEHVFLEINGEYFSTSGNNPGGGAGWQPGTDGQPLSSFKVFHYTTKTLEEPYTAAMPQLTGGGAQNGGEEEATSATDPLIAGKVSAFTGQLEFPNVMETATSLLLTGQRALMNDVSLMPFVQQVANASLRHFMSLPDGTFYAFYPDYFGEFGHHEPYWEIPNLEIIEGGINLSDSNLVTHVYAVGDNTWPAVEQFLNEIKSAGTISIFNAFGSNGVVNTNILENKNFNNVAGNEDEKKKGKKGKAKNVQLTGVMDTKEAQDFLRRYGARPLVLDLPMVRSPLYEMIMAYQGFCRAWSKQFITPFRFTFMPEIYPGGKIGFPEHGLQMYVESVTHEWDTTTGYLTEAQLSSPSQYTRKEEKGNPSVTSDLPPYMVDALVDPIRDEKKLNEAAATEKRAAVSTGKKAAQTLANAKIKHAT